MTSSRSNTSCQILSIKILRHSHHIMTENNTPRQLKVSCTTPTIVYINMLRAYTTNIYMINHRLHCDDKCAVYLLYCKQYVVQTTDRFCFRWNNYNSGEVQGRNIHKAISIYVSLWQRAYARNIRFYYPYRQYTNLLNFDLYLNRLPIYVAHYTFISNLFLSEGLEDRCFWPNFFG